MGGGRANNKTEVFTSVVDGESNVASGAPRGNVLLKKRRDDGGGFGEGEAKGDDDALFKAKRKR